MEFKGAQGEWISKSSVSDRQGLVKVRIVPKYDSGFSSHAICTIDVRNAYSKDEKEALANVRLIEAAPDLLEACVEFVRKCDNGTARSVKSYKQMSEAINKALING
jgi:hypothetical protein